MSFIQRRTIHGLGEYSSSQSWSYSQGIFGQDRVYGVLEEATQKQGMTGKEVEDFLIRLAGPVF